MLPFRFSIPLYVRCSNFINRKEKKKECEIYSLHENKLPLFNLPVVQLYNYKMYQ